MFSRVVQSLFRRRVLHPLVVCLAATWSISAPKRAQQEDTVLAARYWVAMHRGDREEAQSLCSAGQRYYPENPNFGECELAILANFGDDVPRAWNLLARIDTLPPFPAPVPHRQLYVAAVIARAGMSDSALSVIERARQDLSDQRILTNLQPMEAWVRVLVGDHDEAVRVLAAFLQKMPEETPYIARHHWFAALHDNPHFQALLER
ncbi:MAG: hypothetical protein JSV86_14585 [Gemmatimonadota bacterium]|nr:MAG: hypothetical protein JSV86_14585 [Gemmatimonadota bacterium]